MNKKKLNLNSNIKVHFLSEERKTKNLFNSEKYLRFFCFVLFCFNNKEFFCFRSGQSKASLALLSFCRRFRDFNYSNFNSLRLSVTSNLPILIQERLQTRTTRENCFWVSLISTFDRIYFHLCYFFFSGNEYMTWK